MKNELSKNLIFAIKSFLFTIFFCNSVLKVWKSFFPKYSFAKVFWKWFLKDFSNFLSYICTFFGVLFPFEKLSFAIAFSEFERFLCAIVWFLIPPFLSLFEFLLKGIVLQEFLLNGEVLHKYFGTIFFFHSKKG